jgi:hypothetical protein
MSAQVTINQLPAAGTITGNESVPIVQNGQTVRTTTAAIASAPSQTQTFITLFQETTLPNSRYLGAINGLTLLASSPQGVLNISPTGALLSLVSASLGIQTKTDSTTVVGRTITGTANSVDVTNGSGVSGNPTISISSNPTLPGTGAALLPFGTTAQQPSGTNGQIRFNTDSQTFDGYSAGAWRQFSTAGGVSTFSGGTTGLLPNTAQSGAITLSGTLNVANGGSGANTLTGYLVGNGTSAFTAVATIPNAGLTNSAITIGSTSVSLGGTITTLTGTSINGSTNTLTNIANGSLTNSSITINGSTVSLGGSVTVTASASSALTIGTGLSGISYNGSAPVTIAISSTGVTATSYGSATQVGTFTVNAQGQLTAAGNTTVTPAVGSITGLGTGVATALGNATNASSGIVVKDADNNITANAYFNGFTSVAASGTLITLTVASTPVYLVTGSGGQIIKLPDATTLPLGTIFSFNNNQSSGAITVNNNSNTLVVSIPSGGYVTVALLANGTAAGTWDRHDQTPSNVSWSTNTLDYPGSITSATWNGVIVATNRGGTGTAFGVTGGTF